MVLELAVGTGLNLPLYPDRVRHVLGIDLSEAMLDHARARLRALRLDDRVQVRRGDVQHLDLADASVDTVVATYALRPVPDPRATLLEARRVLRPAAACCSSSTARADRRGYARCNMRSTR
jgi:ubiquinone/menaquinone biosynthesis C-methylase UbiE